MAGSRKSVTPVAKRLRAARIALGLSQHGLGIAAGLDPSVANVRINQYERGTHQPNYQFVCRVGVVTGLPEAYFYAGDDALAEWIRSFKKPKARVRAATGMKRRPKR